MNKCKGKKNKISNMAAINEINVEEMSTLISTVIMGCMFVASEILPFIKKTDGNGLVHYIYTFLKSRKQ